MNVFMLEQSMADVPSHDDWLSASELARLKGFRFEKRRADWRLGRWVAKQALAALLQSPSDAHHLAEFEVRPAPSGAPDVFIRNKPTGIVVSLSHSNGLAVCAIASRCSALGCDIEAVEARGDAFASEYFTAREQTLAARLRLDERDYLLSLLWSAKESALKALRLGLRLDTRLLEVYFVCSADGDWNSFAASAERWHPLQVAYAGQAFEGWWRLQYRFVRTVVSTPSAPPPVVAG